MGSPSDDVTEVPGFQLERIAVFLGTTRANADDPAQNERVGALKRD